MTTKTQMLPANLAGGSQLQSYHQIFEATKPDSSRIPLVGHVITDEDIGVLQVDKHQPISLSKVVKLLIDPHSSMLYDRHLHALTKVVKHYQKGFLMKDLVSVFKILNVCADRLDEHPMYTGPMVYILKICGLPFLKEKTSHKTSYEQIAIESVAQLGYLMRVPSNEVRLEITRTLDSFYCREFPVKNDEKYQANELPYNKNIIEKSDVSETLIKSLALVENDMDVKLAVLDVLQKLSKSSVQNCVQMLKAEAARRLSSRLLDYDPSGQHLFRSVDILWNLLENGTPAELAEQMNNLISISQLREAFIQQLTQGYSHYDRQLRNDLLCVASLVATHQVRAPFVETQFARDLTLLATFQEVKSHNVLVKHLKLAQNHEDFELKKILINILVVLSKNPVVIPILSDGKLLLALFSYVKSNEKTSGPRDWSPAQFEEIQLHAMSALCSLGPLLLEDYMTCQGNTRLLLLLEWCFGNDDFAGTGNSFHGTGGHGNKRAQMKECLRVMRSMISTGDEALLQDMADQGALGQITTILISMLSDRRCMADSVAIEMQSDMLFIVSTLCENDVHRKELFGEDGVGMLVNYLKMDTKQLASGLGHLRLLLDAVDCVWCGVVGCYTTEDFFLENEGVFLLIDLLESCPKNLHNLILGTLLDLCENSKALPHVTAWRGKDDISAPHLLCDIWREEEAELGVHRDSTGAIRDINKPLMGNFQENQGVTSLPATCPSLSIVDVSENMRAKIYAIFSKIGFIDLPGLTTEDHVTLSIIEFYLDFKLGEVWSEVMTELDEENVRPITPDREALEAISRTMVDRAEHVLEVQKELLEAQNQQNLIDEQEFYAEIRENLRQKEKAIKDFHDFLARTSNYQLLKAAKERQELSIEASRIENNYKSAETFHNTDLPVLNTTTFSGRHVAVESTPHALTGGPLVNYDSNTGTIKTKKTHKTVELNTN